MEEVEMTPEEFDALLAAGVPATVASGRPVAVVTRGALWSLDVRHQGAATGPHATFEVTTNSEPATALA